MSLRAGPAFGPRLFAGAVEVAGEGLEPAALAVARSAGELQRPQARPIVDQGGARRGAGPHQRAEFVEERDAFEAYGDLNWLQTTDDHFTSIAPGDKDFVGTKPARPKI